MAPRFLVPGGNGNWNDNSNWSASSGGASGASFPVAGDAVAFDAGSASAHMTINTASACTSLIMSGGYAGTLTWSAQLTLTSTCTFTSGCTLAGSTGPLVLTGAATITSAGKTLPCPLTISTTGAITLGDDWNVTGLVTTTGTSITLSGTSRRLHCNGGWTQSASSGTSGSGTWVLGGGAYTNAGTSGHQQSLELAGNVTISGTLPLSNTGKLTYLSGTITTTGSTLSTSSTGCTLDTAGVTWNNLALGAVTTTLLSNLTFSGTWSTGTAVTIAGAGQINGSGSVTTTGSSLTFNNTGGLSITGTLTGPNGNFSLLGSQGVTVGGLTTAALSGTRTYTLTQGNTYRVTTSLGSGATSTARLLLKSSVPGTRVVFTLDMGATITLAYCDPTDIDSSAGATIVSFGATTTNTLNWLGSVTAGSTDNPAEADVRSGVSYGAGLVGSCAVPSAGDVRAGVAIDATTGTLVLPDQADVLDGVSYGAGGTEFSGTLEMPAESDVRLAVPYGDGLVGTCAVPATTDVRFGVAVDASTGRLELPIEADVVAGVGYGADGTEFTGSLVEPAEDDVRAGVSYGDGLTGTCAVPSPSDVRFGVAVDATTGTVVLPDVGDVLAGVGYGAGGTEFVGTINPPIPGDLRLGVTYMGVDGTLVLPDVTEVLAGVGYGAGGTELVGTVGPPLADDLRSGVVVQGVTGVLELPAPSNVLMGVGYGAGGTEFTGTLPAAGDPLDGAVCRLLKEPFVPRPDLQWSDLTEADFNGYAPSDPLEWGDTWTDVAGFRHKTAESVQFRAVGAPPTDIIHGWAVTNGPAPLLLRAVLLAQPVTMGALHRVVIVLPDVIVDWYGP